jgi:8-oxo-dGTP pyrophosphatase MutT (NUDIX family)
MAAFRIGDWVRIREPRKPSGIGRIESGDFYSIQVRLLGRETAYAYVASDLEHWTPKSPDRVRVLSGLRKGNDYPYVGRNEQGHVLQSGFIQVTVPLDTEFEPVVEEPKPGIVNHTVEIRIPGLSPPPFDLSFPGGGPDVREKPNHALLRECEEKLNRHMTDMMNAGWAEIAASFNGVTLPVPLTLDRVADRVGVQREPAAAMTTSYTHPERSPRSERERRRLDSAKAQLRGDSTWTGRKDRA